jgi:hypothetical protein
MTIETREVLAEAYRGLQKGRSMLSHAVMVDEAGREVRVVCNCVKLDSIADRHASDPGAVPTCPRCRRIISRQKIRTAVP